MRRPELLVAALVLFAGWPIFGDVGSLRAQTPKHNCGFCHNLHGGDYNELQDYAVAEDLCLSCHSDGGPATWPRDGDDVVIPKGVAIHDGSKHTAPTTCWDCHNHEGEAGSNLWMIPELLATPSSGDWTVIFTASSGANSYADGDGTYDGVCEVCHTGTDQHQNDGSPGATATMAGSPAAAGLAETVTTKRRAAAEPCSPSSRGPATMSRGSTR
jgi:predicted CXXCH cytochrome family protein